MTYYIPYLGTFFFSRYPSVALARNNPNNPGGREAPEMGSAALPLLCLPVYAVTMPAGAVASRGLAMQQQPLPPLWHPPPPVWSAAARSRPLLASSSVAVSAAGGAADDPGASVASSVMGLAKNIIGAGVLALSAGIASFSSAPSAAIVGIILLYSLGAISAYTFSLLGRLSERVRGESYVDTFAHIFGTRTALIPAATITFMTGSAALMYAIILGELYPTPTPPLPHPYPTPTPPLPHS